MSLKPLILQKSRDALMKQSAFRLSILGKDETLTKDGIEIILKFFDKKLVKENRFDINSTKDPLAPPFDQNLYVSKIYNYHVLINKFMQLEGHVLFSSEDSSYQQDKPLEGSDFNIISKILEDFDGKGIAYYNCGKKSGCSQMHKHIQYAPLQNNPLIDAMKNDKKLPFEYYKKDVDMYDPRCIMNVYSELLKNVTSTTDHNFIVSCGIAVVVPRHNRLNKYGDIINCVAIAGNVLVPDEERVEVKNDPFSLFYDI